MSDTTTRDEYIRNLRAMADFLEAHPALPVPYSTYVTHYAQSLDEARTMRTGSHGWTKEADGNYISYRRVFGGDEYGRASASYEIAISKQNSESCRQVQVGTRHVEEKIVEAHDEPVYEWVCDEDGKREFDEADESGELTWYPGESDSSYGPTS